MKRGNIVALLVVASAAVAALFLGPLRSRFGSPGPTPPRPAVSAPPRMAGTYWTYGFMGGPTYYLIEPLGDNLAKAQTVLHYDERFEFQVEYRDGRAILMQRLAPGREWDDAFWQRFEPGHAWEPLFELIPSSTSPGDWDLAAMHQRNPLELNGKATLTRAELRAPILSFLHRLTDRRAEEYFDLAWRDSPPRNFAPGRRAPPPPAPEHLAQRLDLALAMTRDHPGDPGFGIFELDALVASGDVARLQAAVERWRPHFAGAPPSLALGFRKAEHSARALQLTAEGCNLTQYMNNLLGGFDQAGVGGVDLRQRLERAGEVWRCTGYALLAPPLSNAPGATFLGAHVDAKVKSVVSVFMLMRGDRRQALELNLSTYRFGQLMSQGESLISTLIGVAICNLALRPMEICVLDGCETPQELADAWARLETLNANETPFSLERALWLEDFGVLTPDQIPPSPLPNFTEAETRYRVANARFQLVRMAAAARYHLLNASALPAVAADFAPLLATLPLDPFTSAPLHFIASPNACTVYSVGPDAQDDRATIAYDPTNGTISRGDLFTVVPRERQYPFPRGGVRANTREELLAQFPGGLPPDPFADTKGRPLNVSPTTPVFVFSWGPDVDEKGYGEPGHKVREIPDVAYDPTNGTTSKGDLFIQVPGR